MKRVSFISMLMFLSGIGITAQEATPAKIWQEYEKAYKRDKTTPLLDFSFAGYHHGESEVPVVEHKVFNVLDFGAIANDHISDREALLKAIDAAEANGSGVIYFPKGRYLFNTKEDPCDPINIENNNIVLRGDGAGVNGTEIYMAEPFRAPNPIEKWTSPILITFNGKSFANPISTVVKDSPKGTFSVELDQARSLRVGDWICLRLSNNSEEVIARELAPHSSKDSWTNLVYIGSQVYDYHKVASVKGNKVTFKEPLMREVRADENWYVQTFPHLKECGVEDIAFVGNFKEKFVHHKDDIHDGGWKLIKFDGVVNSWLRRCRFTDVSAAMIVKGSANVSVYDCVVTGNVGHHSIHSDGSSRVFLGGIHDMPAQWHSVGVTKHTMGTVMWRNITDANSCFECHASQPRASLIDHCESGFIRGRCGGAIQNNPNHLNDLVFWNFKETGSKGSKDFQFWPTDTEYFRFLPPTIVGFYGAGTTFDASQAGYIESIGAPVDPESLYEAQLKLRLGKLPKWLVALKQKVENKDFAGMISEVRTVNVSNTAELHAAVDQAKEGDQIILADGNYEDVQLIVNASGSFNRKLEIKAMHPGKVSFTGDARVEIRGNHILLSGIYFKDGDRNQKEWKSHGPGLVAIYGDYNEVADCLFYDFDDVSSAYITTSLNEAGHVSQYAHIHHCAFLEKQTLDQVINLNNTLKKTLDGEPGKPMYHRVSYCYFSNPKKKGNAGGGIRVGYWRKDYGRCLIDHNMFERQDSEAEIITSKCMENVYWANTFMNCQGTFNFRHGDKQVAINNYFFGTDKKKEYGGMYVWGSNHIIGANYFALPTTIASRGNAALYFNPGPEDSEHALAHTMLIANNDFMNNQGYDLNFYTKQVANRMESFDPKTVKFPYDLTFIGNAFFSELPRKTPLMNDPEGVANNIFWAQNTYNGIETGLNEAITGLDLDEKTTMRNDDSKFFLENATKASPALLTEKMPYRHIEGIDLDFYDLIVSGVALSPAYRHGVGPKWCKEYPGNYYKTVQVANPL